MKFYHSVHQQTKNNVGFTVVEVIVTVVLAALFVGIFVTAISAYQNIRYDTTRRANAYAVARELAYIHRGSSTEGDVCTSTTRQAVVENQTINTNPDADESVTSHIEGLINPRYSMFVQYLNGCESTKRIIIVVHYGPSAKRETVESVAV